MRTINKLSAVKLAKIKSQGLYGDGGGLYLQVTKSGAKSWLFRYKVSGRTRYMGLGSISTVTLADARDAANNCRRFRLLGDADPIDHRKSERKATRLQAAQTISFDDCRDAYLAAHQSAWRNAKHRSQWFNTLNT